MNAGSTGRNMLIVVGMHRSGTSATTGALQCLGVQLGKRLYAGHRDINAKGYFEHSDIADTNDEILFKMGSCWDDVLPREPGWWKRPDIQALKERLRRLIRRDFARSPLWAVKDPRACRLVPLWLDLLAAEGVAPHFLFVVRAPEAVAASLHRRDGFSRDKSFMLWVLHYLEAERASRGHPRSFMAFDRFLEAPVVELARVERELGLQFPQGVAESSDRLNAFLSPDLRHHRSSEGIDGDGPLARLAHDLEAALLSAANGRLQAADFDILDARLTAMQRGFDPLLVEHMRSVAARAGHLQTTMDRVMRSVSWYVGKPIRFIERLAGARV